MKYLNQTLVGLRDKIKAGDIKSQDVVSESLERITARNKKTNAFISINAEALKKAEEIDKRRSQGQSLGRLAGVPIAVKDTFCTKGLRTTAGSRALEKFIPPYSATVVEKLEAEGAIIIGKTNCDEFAMGSSNENSFFGPVENPWKEGFVAGGSSGGSASAQASRLSSAALGTDTGGSIRQPASLCGIYGLKPTYGRVSRYGIVSYASSFDQAGPMACSTGDVAEVLTVMSGEDKKDSLTRRESVPDYNKAIDKNLKGLVIGIPKEYFSDNLSPEVTKTVNQALEALKSQGAITKEISIPHTKYAVPIYYLLATSEASSNLARYDGVRFGYRHPSQNIDELYKKSRSEALGQEVKLRIMLGTFALSSGYYDAFYKKAAQVRRLLYNDFQKAFSECQAIVCPVTTGTAFKIGERVKDTVAMYYNDIFTTSANLTGLPAMSVPAGFSSNGLPIGVQIIAPEMQEQRMLNMSQALEDTLKAGERLPDGI